MIAHNINDRVVLLLTESGTKEIPFLELKKGDRFRLFEADGRSVDSGVINVATSDAYERQGIYCVQVEEEK